VTYTRDNGTTSPTIAGYASLNGLPINDGTFKSADLGMIAGSPPILDTSVDLPNDDGGFDGFPLYGRWPFNLDGEFIVDVVDDVQAAIYDLRTTLNLYAGLQTMTFKSRGFTGTRQMNVRLNGQALINDPGKGQRKVPARLFTIPLLAVDPRQYDAVTLRSVDIGVGATGTLTNNGNYPTPMTIIFVGPLTSPEIDGPGTAGLNRIRLLNGDGSNYVIASGHTVTVQTNPSGVSGVTAVDNTGANVYGKVANRSAGLITPGTSSWTLTTANGADTGHVTVQSRDAWV
jgi:hypothetical protein